MSNLPVTWSKPKGKIRRSSKRKGVYPHTITTRHVPRDIVLHEPSCETVQALKVPEYMRKCNCEILEIRH